MKKLWIILFLVGGIGTLQAQNIDVVVMVDTSWSLWQPFDDIVNYLINSMLDEIVHKGDSFSLLQFSAKTRVEIKERIVNGDTKTFIKNKVLQLKGPLQIGKYTDLLGAIDFLYDYVDSMPQQEHKLIILITDGIHDPPPGSENDRSHEALMNDFMAKARLIKNKGWDVHILQIPEIDPLTGQVIQGNTDKTDYLERMARELEITINKYSPEQGKELLAATTGFPKVIFPGDLGTRGREFTVPFVIRNNGDAEIEVKLIGIRYKDFNILNAPFVQKEIAAHEEVLFEAPVKLPADMSPGRQELDITLDFEGETRVISSSGTLIFTYGEQAGILSPELLYTYILPGLGILLLLVVIILLIVFIRRRGYEKKFVKVVDDTQGYAAAAQYTAAETTTTVTAAHTAAAQKGAAAGTQAAAAKHAPRLKADYSEHSFPIEMIVELQKRHIGFRNIHSLHKNKPVSIGGGHSLFLIFLVPVPAHIAEIYFDGKNFVFTPLKPEFFPHLRGPVKNCLGRQIDIVSEKGYSFSLFFERYISPLEQINALMRSIRENQGG
jgi:hypothetical protein